MHDDVLSSRGATWLAKLTCGAAAQAGFPASVCVVDARLDGAPARYLAVVPDPRNRFPRARSGEVGLDEGWALAQAVRETMADDEVARQKRAIVAIVDVSSQAYGRREEAYGIHQALAGAAAAYAQARLAGHPVIGLIVGKAMSGALLAHGYQANRLVALDDPGVLVHAMGKAAAARVTQRSVDSLERLAADVPPMAYDIASYASLGLLWRLLAVSDADRPNAASVDAVRKTLVDALADIRADRSSGLHGRLGGRNRQASSTVRERLRATW